MILTNVNTPDELMEYLNKNFEYGVIDKDGIKYCDSNSDEFQYVCDTQWRLRSVEEMLGDGVGHCYDQVEIEREWFQSHGYEIKTFWISAYQQGIEDSGFSHTYLAYKDNNQWKLFEHSDFFNRGIHVFNSLNELVKWQAEKQVQFAINIMNPEKEYSVCIKEYLKPIVGLTMNEYLEYINSSEDYNL